MAALSAGLLLGWLAGGAPSFAIAPRQAATPPRLLNIVRHKLKPGTSQAYETLETAIVAAYERAHVPVFWIMLQSPTDATDIVYLNVAESLDEWEEMGAAYRKAAAAHPELEQMSARLATFIDRSTSTLTTRRDEVPFGRMAVDLHTMRALRLTVFDVSAEHERRFVDAARAAAGHAAPWLLYKANDAPTFMLVEALRTASHARKTPAIPQPLNELRDKRSRTDDGVYIVRPQMSHPPQGWSLR